LSETLIVVSRIKHKIHKEKKLKISWDALIILSQILEDVLEAACDKAKRDDSRTLRSRHFKNLVIKLHN
jgi:hypothetical protein